MKTLVVYDSQYGNTERIAKAIAGALSEWGQAEAVRASEEPSLDGVDLLIVGCPTQAWSATPMSKSYLDSMPIRSLRGVAIATFDTRFHRSRWLTGSAAHSLARRIHRDGLTLVAPPESFFVSDASGPLEDGELERAQAWARRLAASVSVSAASHPVTR